MCGIAGFYGFRNDGLIKEISRTLEHRGPDGEGFYKDNIVTLLNRRLAIIDKKGGDQPIFNEDGSIAVVYNGEIYNYRELSEKLKSLGHRFSTKSDTEVIVHGYEQWGNECFDKLNGMFAIALYDTKQKKLLLVRDHFGIKPLYYARAGNKLVFGSEIKAILKSELVKRKPNEKVIFRYLKYRIHDEGRETFFEGINRLLPGELIEINGKGIKISKYTNLEKELLQMKEGESDPEKFKRELIKAVRYRLISEVPVGTCLSGGIDSSTIVSVVNRLLREKAAEAESVGKIQNTFSAVFPGSINDEEYYIDELLKGINAQSHKVKPDPIKFFEEIRDFVKTQEEPTISTGPYAQYKVMQMAHKKVTVVLDGQGADEMMAGYVPYYLVNLRQLLTEKKYFKLVAEIFSSLDILFKIFVTWFEPKIKVENLLEKNFTDRYGNETFKVETNNLKKRLVQDIFSNSLQSLLRYEDKNAMRFSIEGRVPFLDLNLIKTIFQMPSDSIIKNGWNKYILRVATEDLLPEAINRRRNKIGFTTPENEWFFVLEKRIYEIFASQEFGKRKFFNQARVLREFMKFSAGKTGDSMVFWRILNLEIWLREFFDQSPPVQPESEKNKISTPNRGKQLRIIVGKKTYYRYPVKTGLFKKNDDYTNKITDELSRILPGLDLKGKKWLVVVSEKIVAISQGRSYFLWEINPSPFAVLLSKFVKKTPYGIGLGSPWTMQLAIGEIGLPKILWATFLSAVTKPFGISGIFYRVAGETVRSIDGPTEYSLYPSNVSAKLGPENPDSASGKIRAQIQSKLKITGTFMGVAVIDANDIGRNVLGKDCELSALEIEKIMKDNPMGQGSEQTPLIVIAY